MTDLLHQNYIQDKTGGILFNLYLMETADFKSHANTGCNGKSVLFLQEIWSINQPYYVHLLS
jgi:hypothetical protein